MIGCFNTEFKVLYISNILSENVPCNLMNYYWADIYVAGKNLGLITLISTQIL